MDLAAPNKTEALTRLCDLAARLLRGQREEILAAVMDREKLGSTAVGGGVAIPHGKIAGLNEVFMILARVAPGADIGFDGPDGQPVRLLALVLSPLLATTEHLMVLALLGRSLNSPENLRLLMSAPGKESFYALFMELAASAA